MTIFRALKHRPFALLWTGQTISRVGDFLYQVALAWWVLERTGSAVAMSGVLIFSFAPMLVFLLLGGVLVDRWPRVPLMLGSDFGRGLICAVLAGLAFTHLLQIWQVYLASLLFGCVDAFSQPAYQAVVPQLTPEAALPSANALNSFGVQAGRIIGPALGGAIIAFGGAATAFAINAASFWVSTLCLLPLLRVPLPCPERQEQTSVFHDVRAGIGTVFGTPWLWITIVVIAITNVTLSGPYTVAIPFLVKDHWQADARTLGLLYAVFPVGYIVGGLWLGRMPRIRRRGWWAHGMLIFAGLGMLLLGLPIPLVGALVGALINGAALEMSSMAYLNAFQQLVPNDRLGRVSSIELIGSFGLLPVGFALTGWATNHWGAATVCVLGGGMTIIAAMLGLAHPAIRQLD